MEILSTVKPDVPKKPEITIEHNNRSIESFTRNGFVNAIPRSVYGPRDRMQRFLSLVDLRKGPLERTVTMIIRLKAPDWTSTKHERKEFVYYFEDWSGVDWLGIPIDPFNEHIEGRYLEATYRPKIDERTGEHIENVYTGARESFYIPFTKKNVDEIIANSAKSTKSSIRFVVKWGQEDAVDSIAQSMRNQFSYDMFMWDWDRLTEFEYWPVDNLINRPKPGRSATKLEFKPS